jgi:hypothetical protein
MKDFKTMTTYDLVTENAAVREEFFRATTMGATFDVDSAMMKVDSLLDAAGVSAQIYHASDEYTDIRKHFESAVTLGNEFDVEIAMMKVASLLVSVGFDHAPAVAPVTVTLEQAIAEAAALEPLDNPEYFRGISELLARCFPAQDMLTDERAKKIRGMIRMSCVGAIDTGILDSNGVMIRLGDTLKSEWSYSVIASMDDDGDFYGQLVCAPGHSCEHIPYSLSGKYTISS